MSKYINADEYIRKADAVDAVAFEITNAKAINIETGESRDLFANENEELQRAIKRIKALSSADVRENTHGEWIRTSPLTDTFECSLCGMQVPVLKMCSPYCPLCGADMRGETE